MLTKVYEFWVKTPLVRQGIAKFATMNETPSTARTLADLKVGASARITGFDGDDAISRRLFDLGFAPGLTCRLERRAPLLDPLMFNVGGTEIVLRHFEASRVLVKP